MVENQRAVTFLFVVGAALVGLLVRLAVGAVLAFSSSEDYLLAGLVSSTALAGLVAAVVAFFVVLRIPVAGEFTDSVVSELSRVTWPSRDETVNNATIVVGATLFFASVLSFYDFVWGRLTGLVLYGS